MLLEQLDGGPGVEAGELGRLGEGAAAVGHAAGELGAGRGRGRGAEGGGGGGAGGAGARRLLARRDEVEERVEGVEQGERGGGLDDPFGGAVVEVVRGDVDAD